MFRGRARTSVFLMILLPLFLMASSALLAMPAPAAACEDGPGRLCLLGRFAVEASWLDRDGRERPAAARPDGTAGETGLFSLNEEERVDLGVRMVDGRAVNGSFWLIASGLGGTDATLAVSDRETGRTRRFLLRAGEPVNLTELEAFSATAAVVQVTLDTSLTKTQAIGPLGGSIQLTDAQGTRFMVAFPAQALPTVTDITVTPVAAISGLPFSGGLKAAVRIEPEGLIPARTVRLTITPASPVPPAQQLTFSFRGLHGELFLAPPLAGAPIVVPVHRLGGFGLGAGTAADLAAQLLRLPTREEDRLSQRLAGLILPLRRSGKVTPPAAVAQILQQEFTTRIKPRLADVKKGNLERNYAQMRNWSNSAKDSGLAKADTVASLEAQLEAAEIAAARAQFNRDFGVCIAKRDPNAMRRVFLDYYDLQYLHAPLTQGDVDKLLRCAHFELHWDTEILFSDQFSQGIFQQHDSVETTLQLSYSLARNVFFSGNRQPVIQFPKLSFPAVPCFASLASEPAPIAFTVEELHISTLSWYDDDLSPLRPEVALTYSIAPSLVFTHWKVACDGVTDDTDVMTSWTALYCLAHDCIFKETLRPPSSSGATTYAEKEYHRTVEEITEITSFDLFFKPQ
jgi:hypothetical protein